MGLLLAVTAPAAAGAETDGGSSDRHTWFAVSEDRRGADVLTRLDPDDPDPAGNEIVVGTTGTGNIEAIALQPGSGILFAANAEQLGIIDPVTGRFSPKEGPIGAGTGAEGELDFSDVDGLTFDPATGALYGTQRRETEPDVLIRIDPDTGAHVPDAFGAGVDYVVVAPQGDLHDVGDIAFARGVLYAIANRYGHSGDHLVRVDTSTGATSEVGPVGTEDVQGLCATPEGSLHGSTGNFAPDGEAIWDIDSATGQATNPRALDESTDFESLACGTASTPAASPAPAPPATTPGPPPADTAPAPPPADTAPAPAPPATAPAPAPPATAPAPPPRATAPAPAPPPAMTPAPAPAMARAMAPAPAPPAVAGETQSRELLAVPDLPRTGGQGSSFLLIAGLAIAVGGLAIAGGQRSAPSARG